MSERVSHDNSSVRTVDATLTRSGRTDRPKVVIQGDARDDFPTGEVVRLVLDGTEYRARIEDALSGDELEFRGAYDTPRLARTPGEGTNHLVEWRRDASRSRTTTQTSSSGYVPVRLLNGGVMPTLP